MNIFKRMSLFVFTGLVVAACGTYPCGKASSSLALIGFTDTESDQLILKRFTKGSNFTNSVDTFDISAANSHFQRQGDTLLILHSIESRHDITSDYDFEVFIPGAGKTYRLTDIIEDIQYGKKSGPKIYCINPLTSFKLDGQAANTSNIDFIYLRK